MSRLVHGAAGALSAGGAFLRACRAASICLAAAAPAMADPAQAQLTSQQDAYLQSHQISPGALTPRYLSGAPGGGQKMLKTQQTLQTISPGSTLPYWSTTVTSPLDHVTYNVSMVGSSPYVTKPANTDITYVPIAVRLHFPGGYVFDPTTNANCDTRSASNRFFYSPIFRAATYTSNGVNVSAGVTLGTQLVSAYQRANFWGNVKGSQYGIRLMPKQSNPIVVDYTVTYPDSQVVSIASQCGKKNNPFGEMDINEYDALVQSLAAKYATPTQLPVVLAYNVVLVDGSLSNCCIIGYHNAVPVTGGTQIYAVGTYVDPGVFSGISDIGAWSHEIAELYDDPFVQSISGVPGGFSNDLTPAWGHLGQVGGCQNNLENGDPLTGSQFAVTTTVGGATFTYHYQDLAFLNWFYRTPSTAAGNAGSFQSLLPPGGQPTVCQ